MLRAIPAGDVPPRGAPADGGVLLRGTVSRGPVCLHTPMSHWALSSGEVNLELCSATASPIRMTAPRLVLLLPS